MAENMIPVAIFAFLAVGALALFGWLSVASWSEARRREREAFYKNETLRKIAEAQGAGGPAAVELYRELERAAARKFHESCKLGGVISIGVGIGLMVFLKGVGGAEPAYLVGLIPALSGVALLIYVYFLASKPQ